MCYSCLCHISSKLLDSLSWKPSLYVLSHIDTQAYNITITVVILIVTSSNHAHGVCPSKKKPWKITNPLYGSASALWDMNIVENRKVVVTVKRLLPQRGEIRWDESPYNYATLLWKPAGSHRKTHIIIHHTPSESCQKGHLRNQESPLPQIKWVHWSVDKSTTACASTRSGRYVVHTVCSCTSSGQV